MTRSVANLRSFVFTAGPARGFCRMLAFVALALLFAEPSPAAAQVVCTALPCFHGVNANGQEQLLAPPAGSGSAQGPAGPAGPQGAPGVNGTNGLAIASATVNSAGHLILTMTDTSTIDAGAVVGAVGAPGAAGAGVQGAAVNGSGQLVLTLADGSQITATGAVVGPQGPAGAAGAAGSAGVGISSATINSSGQLVLTLTSGSPITVGNVVGPAGAAGAPGATGPAGSFSAGTAIAAETLGAPCTAGSSMIDPSSTATSAKVWICGPGATWSYATLPLTN